jgi:hypothetical protein
MEQFAGSLGVVTMEIRGRNRSNLVGINRKADLLNPEFSHALRGRILLPPEKLELIIFPIDETISNELLARLQVVRTSYGTKEVVRGYALF